MDHSSYSLCQSYCRFETVHFVAVVETGQTANLVGAGVAAEVGMAVVVVVEIVVEEEEKEEEVGDSELVAF